MSKETTDKMDNKKTISDIKRVPILSVASKLGIVVNKQNKSLCIVHDDTNPSMSFNTKENYFKCFSCGAGGDNIKLVQTATGCDFKQALEFFRDKFNIQLDAKYKSYSKPFNKPHKTTYSKPSVTTKKPKETPTISQEKRTAIYQYLLDLISNKENNQEALNYLKGRGIEDLNIIQQMGIKCLPKDTRTIKQQLEAKYKQQDLINSGVLALSKDGKPYLSLFSHRLIFPYYQTIEGKRQIITLQGRDIDTDKQPKYKFLPTTKPTLYNIDAIEQSEAVCICEGAMDVLSVYQLREAITLGQPIGIPGVNGWRDEYYKLIEDKEIVLGLDGDKAGNKFSITMSDEIVRRTFKRPSVIDFSPYKANDLNEIIKEKTTI